MNMKKVCGVRVKVTVCHKRGHSGHWAKECPNPQGGGSYGILWRKGFLSVTDEYSVTDYDFTPVGVVHYLVVRVNFINGIS